MSKPENDQNRRDGSVESSGLFDRCVRRTRLKTGEVRHECRLGLWSIEGRDEDFVYNEARRYFFQYYNDGEYAEFLSNELLVESHEISSEQ